MYLCFSFLTRTAAHEYKIQITTCERSFLAGDAVVDIALFVIVT
jgi:hypothetical protein